MGLVPIHLEYTISSATLPNFRQKKLELKIFCQNTGILQSMCLKLRNAALDSLAKAENIGTKFNGVFVLIFEFLTSVLKLVFCVVYKMDQGVEFGKNAFIFKF